MCNNQNVANRHYRSVWNGRNNKKAADNMGFFDKKLSFGALKDAVSEAAAKVGETVQNADVAGKVTSIREAVSETTTRVTGTVKTVDLAGALASAKETVTEVGGRAIEATQAAYEITREKACLTYDTVAEEVGNFDYAQLKSAEFYQERFAHYKDLSQEKVTEYFRSTFEVDKSTMQMVDDVRSRLPVPADTVDDIFEQCKKEAIRRAVASFGLAGIVQGIDHHSEAKYSNLSENWNEYKSHEKNNIQADPNYKAMSDIRGNTIAANTLGTVEDGYNKAGTLFAVDAQVEHVIAKKEYYDDLLIRAGTTNAEFNTLINSKENLVFADGTFNGSLQDKNIYKYLAERGRPHESDPDLILVDITQKTGEIKTVTLNKNDVDEACQRADENRQEHRLNAAIEVGTTVVKSGAAMAAQQVVGLIVVETIDIFVDEIRDFAVKGRIINADGWLQNTKDATARVRQRLEQRFEERQLWTRARELGIESGVAGALSVIPQILISFIVRMPAFVLAMIRESTLSVVRCVRILASNDQNKLDSIGVILAATASTIVGVYASHAISKAIMAAPLLKTFDRQVSEVLAGLLVTAVPLTAIYVFDQNKQKLTFIASKFPSFGSHAV